ncbi:MAG: thermonuclease family protein [Alphaproteobacteria bacterium]
MRRLVVCIALAAGALSGPARADITGTARAIDGDTIEIGGRRLELWGIDAPESRQTCVRDGRVWPCGETAARVLGRLIAGKTVNCRPIGAQSRAGPLVKCGVGGLDLGAELVERGLALADTRRTRYYLPNQHEARNFGSGMWGGLYVRPWEWRRGRRINRDISDNRGCAIKGDITAEGARIYHLPGGTSYERTRIDVSTGERWFCAEEDAQAAGWRRADD